MNTDGHIPRWWFRTHVWLPTVEAAGMPWSVTVHGLRHAHASWLLAGGADLEVVKERLGHSSIVTSQKYLAITLDETDETAIDALHWARTYLRGPGALDNSARGVWTVTDHGLHLTEDQMLAEIRQWKRDLRQRSRSRALIEEAADWEEPELRSWKDQLIGCLLGLPSECFQRLAQ